MRRFIGISIATPIIQYLVGSPTGVVRGSGYQFAYIDIDGFVIGVTSASIPAMPNGIVVVERPRLNAFRPGTTVEISVDAILSPDAGVRWRGLPVWDPTVPQGQDAADDFLEVGQEIWHRLRLSRTVDPGSMVERLSRAGYEVTSNAGGRNGMEALFRSLVDRDPELARRAGMLLIGRGPGLTPEGDDFLAAAAATIFACEPSIGWTHGELSVWRSAVLPDDLRGRTTALSATLLELAVEGYVSEPVQTLFNLNAPFEEWHGELNRLKRVGHGTGRAWAAGCAAAAILLTR